MKSRGGGWSRETGRGIDRLRRKLERERPVKRAKKRQRGRKEGTGVRRGFGTDSVRRRFCRGSAALVSGLPRTRRAAGCGRLAAPPPTPPPHLAQGGRNGVGARGLFGAVEWKIDFNPLCGYKGARSALADRGSRRSGGPLPRPGLESLQSHAARGTPGLGAPAGPNQVCAPGRGRAVFTDPGCGEEAERAAVPSSQCVGRVRVAASPPQPGALLGLGEVFTAAWKARVKKFAEYWFSSPTHPQEIIARNGNLTEQSRSAAPRSQVEGEGQGRPGGRCVPGMAGVYSWREGRLARPAPG